MHFLRDYGLFLLEIMTVVLAILILTAGILAIARSRQKEKPGKLVIHKLNEKYDDYLDLITEETLTKTEKKQHKKVQKQKHKQHNKDILTKKRLFVLEFQGDMKASSVVNLREEIDAILVSRKVDDEVLLCLESPGGLVHAYGLAAAEVQRLRDAKIKLIVAVDKIAASGGYMMACLADHILAAPFAVIGSIGVIAQLPNFHRWLDKKNIDFEQILAGQYKRTLTIFGKNTLEGRKKLQSEVNDTHDLFKNFIVRFRPQVNIEEVATGEHWYGARALELKLVDDIKTSDDFLLSVKDQYEIYLIKYEIKKNISSRIGSSLNSLLNHFSPATNDLLKLK